jgi:hypothetical protein
VNDKLAIRSCPLSRVFTRFEQAGGMSKCQVARCVEPADGSFLLAPGAVAADLWLTEDEARAHAVPLCQWHALLLGDQRAPERR